MSENKKCLECGSEDNLIELKNGKYVLDGAYSKCQKCEQTKEFTEDELKQELLIK